MQRRTTASTALSITSAVELVAERLAARTRPDNHHFLHYFIALTQHIPVHSRVK
jgi:hypothetical protein